jgi:hypothetical protein
MSMGFDDLIVGGQLRVGAGYVPPIKEGDEKINGSAHMEGPVVFGAPSKKEGGFDENVATLMIARTTNTDPDCTPADRSLWVKGNTRLQGDAGTSYTLNVTGDVTIIGNTEQTGDTNQVGNITASGTIKAATLIGAHTSGSISGGVSGKSSGAKAFDIPHPSREGYRLRHICLEGPESAVYFRGRLKNRKVIKLPTYWEKLVDPTTITVNLTPFGSHQDIIVKRLDSTEIHLQSNGGLPIDCFYHVYGTRQDIERLSVEYEGATSDDYPGDNSIYSINK